VAFPPVPELSALSPGADPLSALTGAAAKDPRRADLQLAIGSVQLQAGDVAAARAAFEHAAALGDRTAAIALAVAAYDPAHPETAVARLRTLAERPGALPFARYEYGVVQVWAGRLGDATATLRALRAAAPESYYGVKADDLLHPGYQPGYPPFVPAQAPAVAGLAALQAAAAARPGDAEAQLQAGAALQAVGRRREALDSYRRALASDSQRVETEVAIALGAFSKDDPSAAFGTIGPLARDHPHDPSPRFHLALMLFWIGQREEAQAQFTQVIRDAPSTRLAKLATIFLSK
jgi:tetratricopeptide (TPR) repeat protein